MLSNLILTLRVSTLQVQQTERKSAQALAWADFLLLQKTLANHGSFLYYCRHRTV